MSETVVARQRLANSSRSIADSSALSSGAKLGNSHSGARQISVLSTQIVLIGAFLLGWQYLPTIVALQHVSHVFDPFFVSSPSRIALEIVDLLTGQHDSVMVWPYAWATLSASLIGTIIGMALGATAGLILSNFNFLGAVVRPFLVAANATPRIALIPIIILLFGISATSSAVVAILVVFFIAFFNALMGGRSIAPELVGNARLLGASEWGILREVRLPYVLAWTLAAMPIALTFSVISVVTGEILTGYPGMGRLLSTATNTVDSTLTFAVVFFLAAIGLVTVMISDFLQARILHWWGK